ncbi:MAG: 3-dehydroquinate synthase [Gemmatimonadetes bacterium]|nr:3-dehydroquinate synthase [Gemmatimonadota bacterium]MYG14931.1 3-dehydroquinate synthase [Gemmatimonadota bacterium]
METARATGGREVAEPGKHQTGGIVLIGFMGTGKTAVGWRLARALGVPFVDTDALIEKKAAARIPEIFEQQGESGFRAIEKAVIRSLADGVRRVVATGGGAVLDPDNFAVLRSLGPVIHLKAPAETVLARTRGDSGVRPLLAGNDPLERIRSLQRERAPVYGRADHEIDTSRHTIEETVGMVKTWAESEERVIRVDLGPDSYDIVIGPEVLDRLGQRMKSFDLTGRALVVTHPGIAERYGGRTTDSLRAAGFEPDLVEVPEGEAQKSLPWAEKLYDAMLDHGMDRRSPVIALGGGVIGDLAGFAAATFLRGVPFIQVPTSLLAQVDASVGGKVAVDHRRGKNLIGAFYQPLLVLASLDTLDSLPDRELRAGMAEVIKYGVIADPGLFAYIEGRLDDILKRDRGVLAHLVARSCEIKAEVVAGDEREQGRRAILNFGHTMGHAIETQTGMLHGEAVAIGMVYAARVAERMEMLDGESVRRLIELVRRTGLPDRCDGLDVPATIETMKFDKKSVGGRPRFILPGRIGEVAVRDDVPAEYIRSVLATGN